MPNLVDLEPQAKAVVDANANPPYLFELGPNQGRRTVDAVQSGPVKKHASTSRTPPCPAARPARCRCAGKPGPNRSNQPRGPRFSTRDPTLDTSDRSAGGSADHPAPDRLIGCVPRRQPRVGIGQQMGSNPPTQGST